MQLRASLTARRTRFCPFEGGKGAQGLKSSGVGGRS